MSGLVQHLGFAVRQWRESRGWTQEQLAAHAGLNRTYVGEIERGSCIASIVTVEKLAQALEVPIARLLTTQLEQRSASLTDGDAENVEK
ncbi:DNA-binding protein [Caballeronia cordobensis]|uniref:DNA-binding protein n=1 Tax=Caballeronia cordobensis TaxID=1353886 RepID=A0A158GQ76_CABCO|nr:helix-turn-helix transcriptional regulator [Caballeronia cordobensis]SAL33570.1 DNA-binding protein [Caballeronia cordobensis]